MVVEINDRKNANPLNKEAIALLEKLKFYKPTLMQIDVAKAMVKDLQRKDVTWRNLEIVLRENSTLSMVIKHYLTIKRKQLQER